MPLTEPAGVYRPRHPVRTVVYRLFEEHFERYVREYEERYEPREGSLRKVEGGFARIRCPDCRAERLLAFSCRTRNLCPSCQAKRSALFAEHVVTEILEPLPHRHVVLTIPRVLRGLFQRERRLFGLLARAARDAFVPSVRAILDRRLATRSSRACARSSIGGTSRRVS
jgi:ribosomal protein S27E